MKHLIAALYCLVIFLPMFGHAQEARSVNLAQTPFQVTHYDAEEAISAALFKKGIVDKLAVSVDGNKNTALFYHTKPVTVEVKGLQVARVDNRWTASLLFVSDGEVVSAIPAGGHYETIVELPVLKRSMRPGEVITEADLEIRDFSSGHIRNDTISDLSELVGRTPVRGMSPSRPIKHQEVAAPAVIKKNAIVELRYNSPGMLITAQGEAMADGAKGDIINVKNTTSKKVIRGVITSNNTVSITAPQTQTSELTRNETYAN